MALHLASLTMRLRGLVLSCALGMALAAFWSLWAEAFRMIDPSEAGKQHCGEAGTAPTKWEGVWASCAPRQPGSTDKASLGAQLGST